MNKWTAHPGRVCISKSGRDAGRAFIIKSCIDEQYVYITDGSLRKVDTPKKKKLRHVELRGDVIAALQEKFDSGAKVFDAEVKSALRELGYIKK